MNSTQLLDLLQLIPIQRAAVALIIASIGMPIIGVFVVGLNIVAVRFAMMHVALLGIALGLILGVEPLAVALPLCALTGAAVTPVARRPSGLADVMGLVMTLAIAGALFTLSLSGVNANGAFELLWGSILATRRSDVLILALISGLVLLIYLWQRRDLALLLYDRELALCSGMPVERLTLVLLVLVAVAIAAAVRLTGALLVDSITLLPALAARNLSNSFTGMVRWAIAIGLVGNLLGFLLTLWFNQPPGPMLVLVVGLFTILTYFKSAIFKES